LLFVAGPVLATLSVQAIAQTRAIAVDASAVTGVIRPLQGLNNGPTGYHRQPVPPNSPNVIQQYRDIGIDTVRTHDSGSDVNAWIPATGLSGDSNGARESIFPTWNADPYAVDSYDFRRSDQVVNSIVAAGAEPYFRLGSDHDPRPPADFDKYAEICKHVVMHYNGGWAKGYHYNIRYWEFWNEPNLSLDWEPFTKDNRTEWLGSPEQFFQLYAKVARAIVAYDPNLKIGTGAIAEGGRRSVYREQLMEYCAKNSVPLDFYSWHHYHDNSSDPYDLVRIAREIRLLLNSYGLRRTESHADEWNMSLDERPQKQNSLESAAFTATALIYMQDAPVDLSHYYSGNAGDMGPFESDGSLRKKAFVFKATSQMLETPQRVEATGADTVGYAVLAGRSRNSKKVQILISNYEMGPVVNPPVGTPPGIPGVETFTPKSDRIRYTDKGYALTVKNLPWGSGEFGVRRYRITEKENLTLAGESTSRGGSLSMVNELAAPGVELIVLEAR
jgi:hypothetical protein